MSEKTPPTGDPWVIRLNENIRSRLRRGAELANKSEQEVARLALAVGLNRLEAINWRTEDAITLVTNKSIVPLLDRLLAMEINSNPDEPDGLNQAIDRQAQKRARRALKKP